MGQLQPATGLRISSMDPRYLFEGFSTSRRRRKTFVTHIAAMAPCIGDLRKLTSFSAAPYGGSRCMRKVPLGTHQCRRACREGRDRLLRPVLGVSVGEPQGHG